MDTKSYYVTTAIDYVNGRPHLGTAYEKVCADAIARYHRMLGERVHFLMGNDEHSLKVEAAAKAKGMTPLEHCDEMEGVFREVWAALDVSFDDFIRTTQDRHRRAVVAMVERIERAGDIYRARYEGWYCQGCEAFKNEGDLVEGRCPEHPSLETAWLQEQNWFFKLSEYGDRLLAHYEAHPQFVQPEVRRNEMLELLRSGLRDISVSRETATWGVPFPGDEKAVVYVWFDALINYVSATGWPDDGDGFTTLWPADLHLIGKDVTRFHCVIWPAMLMSAGLPLPKCVFGHGFVNMGKERMSKSQGSKVDPAELAARYGADALRFHLMAEAAFGRDLEYSEERLVVRANTELANGLGNLFSRSVAMLVKYRDGRVPRPEGESPMPAVCADARARWHAALDALDLRGGIEAAMSIVTRANALVDEEAPWALAKDPARAARLDLVLHDLVESCRVAAVLLFPFMPTRMGRMLTALGRDASAPLADEAAWGGLAPGAVLEKGEPIFPRVELPS